MPRAPYSSPGRHVIRKTALLTVLTAMLLAPMGVAAGDSAAATTAAARQTPSLVVSSITPDAPRERSTEIKLSGTYVNTGSTPLSSLRLRLRYSNRALTSRAEMEAYQAGQDPWRDRASLSQSLDIPALAPGAKQAWSFTVTPAAMDLWGFGVYPLAVEVVDATNQTLARQRTFLPFAPKNTKVKRTKMAVVLPLLDQQPRRSDDRTFLDDGLRGALTGDGRLADMLALVKQSANAKGVTWLVDPALLDDVRAMTKPYVVGTGGDRKERPAEAAATPWLDGMRAALGSASVAATPYADPDVAALAHQGLDGMTAMALTASAEAAKANLGRDVPTTLNWPVTGLLDHDALDELAVGGVKTVVLSHQNLPPAQTPLGTPDAAASLTSVSGDVDAMVADEGLSELVGSDVSVPGSAVLARQRFIAETAMISGERPDTAKNVVVAPFRRWSPDPAFVSGLLKSAAGLPWLAPTPITSLKRPAAPEPRAGLTYTEQNRRDELGKGYLATVKRAVAQAKLTADITEADDRHGFERSLLRLSSAAWRGKTGTARAAVEHVAASVADRVGQVAITGTDQPRTLAGSDGVIPISVHNALDKTITLKVEVKSTSPKLLQIGAFDPPPPILRGQNQTVNVPLTASTDGETMVTVQLRTADGKKYGPPVKLVVRTTGYTGIALVIVGAALSVMLAAVVLRVVRRRTRRSGKARSEARAVQQPEAKAGKQHE
ncbi:DUF6049 family protein [Streptosporangium soli]|nr:DUF6049 family protein [Streptosporangium sp. KLBMP 9127]